MTYHHHDASPPDPHPPMCVLCSRDVRFRCNNERPSIRDCNWVYHESFYSEKPLHTYHKNTLMLNPSAFFDNWPPSGSSTPVLTDLRVKPYDGKWHHAAYVKEGSNRKIQYYLDGQLAATEDWEPYQGKYATTTNVVGGHRPEYMKGSQSFFEGFMWDLYVWRCKGLPSGRNPLSNRESLENTDGVLHLMGYSISVLSERHPAIFYLCCHARHHPDRARGY